MPAPAPPPAPTSRPTPPDSGWAAFRRLLTFWSPFRGHVAAAAASSIAVGFLSTVIPTQTGRAIDRIRAQDWPGLHHELYLLIAAALGIFVLSMSRRVVAGIMSLGIEQTLRERIFTHLTGLSFRFFDRQQTGQLLSRVTSDVTMVRFFLGYGLIYMFLHVAKLLIIPVQLWRIDPTLALIAYAMTPLTLLVSARYSRLAHPIMRESQQRLALVTAHGEETIVGARVVRSFGQEAREVARFRELAGDVVEQERRGLIVSSRYRPLFDLIPNLTLIVIVLVAAHRIKAGDLTVGSFVGFFFLVYMLGSPLRILGNLLTRAQRATASSSRLWELLDADDRIPQVAHPTPLPQVAPGARCGEVRFEAVTFGYRDGRPVVDDVTLTIPAGSTVALVGPTGCGKSTLAALVPRFYDPEAGRVTLDGIDVRETSLAELRRSIGLVDQEPFLFSATIAENLRFGNPSATDADVRRALEQSQAAEFVDRLPDGIQTIVGERGLTLSGGQRQRLAIARALVIDPRVLILDDATASVDSRVEAHISEALSGVVAQRTTIVIAHRPSTIALADHIVVMGDGRIDDQGTHDELIRRNPTYQLIQEQTAVRREFLMDEWAEAERSGSDERSGGLA